MQGSSINLLVVGLSLLCLVRTLHSDRPSPFWINYQSYNPVDLRAYPVHRVEAFSEQYRPPIVQESPSYANQPSTFGSSHLRSPSTFLSHLERASEVKYPREEEYYYRDATQNDQKQREDTKSDLNEDEIIEKMRILDKLLSEESNQKDFNSNAIEDRIITEESKRVVRQVRKQKPGFFWTLARITFETINDTSSAIKQISDIINNAIVPDTVTQDSMSSALTAIGSVNTTVNATVNATETSTTSPTTSTQASFVLTRSRLQSLIRRNVLGLVRLFNIEWRDALNQSEVNVREFQKDLGDQVGIYLRDNPEAYRGL